MTQDRKENIILSLTLNKGQHEKYRKEIDQVTGGTVKDVKLGAEDTLLVDYKFWVDYFGGCALAIENLLVMLDDPDLVVNYNLDVLNHRKALVFELGNKLERLAQQAEARNAPKTPSWSERQKEVLDKIDMILESLEPVKTPGLTQPTLRDRFRHWVKSWF